LPFAGLGGFILLDGLDLTELPTALNGDGQFGIEAANKLTSRPPSAGGIA
jgi:hypothetical protein